MLLSLPAQATGCRGPGAAELLCVARRQGCVAVCFWPCGLSWLHRAEVWLQSRDLGSGLCVSLCWCA